MISPSIPPPRPAGVEEGGRGGREGKRFIVVHSFITVDLFVISSFGFQDQHRIYISKSVTFYVFFVWSLMRTEDIRSVFLLFCPSNSLCLFFCMLSEFTCRNGPHRWTSYEFCDVNEDNAGFNLRFFLSHFISDKVCYETKVRREKRRCFRKRISLFGSLVFIVF